MCGIAGVIREGALRSDVVPAFWRVHEHRGPDDRGYLALKGDRVHAAREWDPRDATADVVLAHNRLTVIDTTPAGWQPMSSADRRRHLVFNGEIYNHVELRAELEKLGHQFRSMCDTEVLLEAYSEWGVGALARFVGMFAFALLDQDRQVLVMARDFMGIKPLLYSSGRDGFVFGSSIRAVMEATRGPRVANPASTYEFLRFGLTDHREQTLVEGINHLLAGHYMEVPLSKPRDHTPMPFWKVPEDPAIDISFRDAAEAVRDSFFKSVDLHLRSDVPVGAALSGGIDSSSIVAAMREIKGKKLDLHTFTFVPGNSALSEERWADLVGVSAGAHVHKVRPTADNLADELDDFIESLDEPVGSLSCYAQRCVFRSAHEAGIKVLLDGQGADEVLGGYSRYLGARLATLFRGRNFRDSISLLRGSSAGRHVSAWHTMGQSGRFLLPPRVQRSARRLIGKDVMPRWINADWVRERDVQAPTIADEGPDVLRGELRSDLKRVLPHLLRNEDRNSMASSVESRVPYLTQEFVELCLGLPEEFIVSNAGESKTVFREAMRGSVPQQVLDRTDKGGFAAPDREWLLQLRPWVLKVARSESARYTSILNSDELQRRASFAGDTPGAELWRSLNLIEWARLFGVSFR